MLFLFAALAAGLFASASAQSNANNGDGELLIPGIWIDPDGCEHWAMDDRFEGFMSPVVLPNGRPVCGRDPDGPRTCGLLLADMIFASDSAKLVGSAVEALENFFRNGRRRTFVIDGHTDSRASVAHNVALSQRRAEAVATVGRNVGAKIHQVRALGEGHPRASNSTVAGRALNRRVKILCVR